MIEFKQITGRPFGRSEGELLKQPIDEVLIDSESVGYIAHHADAPLIFTVNVSDAEVTHVLAALVDHRDDWMNDRRIVRKSERFTRSKEEILNGRTRQKQHSG